MSCAASVIKHVNGGRGFVSMKFFYDEMTYLPVFCPADRSLWIMLRLLLEPNPRFLHAQTFKAH